jgi:hypothetical protein
VPLIVLAVVVVALLALAALPPLLLVLRYRAGTARRQARGWVAAINILGASVSTALLLAGAALTSLWAPTALTYALGGLAIGSLLGLLGLLLSRWEATPRSLHYTPNRWLVLAILVVVASRLIYGLWRAGRAWWALAGHASWLAASGIAGSFGAGALVLGYYLTYWTGLWYRLSKHRRRLSTTLD